MAGLDGTPDTESRREQESLRDFQSRLAERLALAETGAAGGASRLGFIAGGRHWLVALDQINEVVTLPGLTEVPWARPWFVGVASVRGSLYGCTDLAAYLGLAAPIPKGEVRLLLAHPRHGINAALRIDRALGLRALDKLTPEPGVADAPAWRLGDWRDENGQVWTEISLENLVTTPEFMDVTA